MLSKIVKTTEHLIAFGALIIFLTLISTNDTHAQNAWDQCTDGRSISKCETYDCPQGDTNNDGSCTLEDDGARLTDVRNDSFCANPISGCGEVRYFGAGDSNSCSVRVEENDNNCELYSVAQPTFTPRATASPTSTASPAPTANSQNLICSSLVATPLRGSTPLEVDFEIKASGNLANVEEYEYVFTAPDGTSNGTVVQNSADLTQEFTEIGTHKVTANVITTDGTRLTRPACQKEIVVTNRSVGGGGAADDGEELPETGSPLLIGLGILLIGIAGVYMYDKYRFV